MASKYVLLECNRLRANLNYKNIDEEEDQFKNEWTNNVNSYGIVCDVGDVITCESSAINTVGASDATIEFLGKENKNGYLDNQAQIEFAYYVSDSGANLVKMPLKLERNSNAPFFQGADLRYETLSTVANTNQYLVRGRMVGETNFEASTVYDVNAPIAGGIVSMPELLPQTQLVNIIKLSTATADIGTGYREQGLYEVPEQQGRGGEGMQIRVLEIINESSTSVGIPTKIEIHAIGENYEIANRGAVYQIGNALDGGSNPTKQQNFTLPCYINPFFVSRNGIGATGKKYYFPETNYTGTYQSKFDGQPTNNAFNLDALVPDFELRKTTINYEVPVGLNTPDNVGAILTNQMVDSKRARPDQELEFINYKNYEVKSTDFQDNEITVKPPLVISPSYQPMPSNGQGQVEKLSVPSKSFSGVRQLYYNKVGFLDPFKLKGVGFFNQWYYGLDQDDPKNEIHSGGDTVGGLGNFATQSVGDIGQFTACMLKIPDETVNAKTFLKYPKNGIILTNIYYNERTLAKISAGFRTCEEYYGDLTEKFQSPLPSDKMGVNFDVGRYCTFISDAYPKGTAGRFRIKTPTERWSNLSGANPLGVDVVNVGTTNTGNIPQRASIYDDELTDNDGEQLPQLIVRSRFDASLYYDPDRDGTGSSTDPNNIYQVLYNIVSTQNQDFSSQFYQYQEAMPSQFVNSFTDQVNGKTYETKDLIQMAKDYNLAVIPIFPAPADEAGGTDFNQNNQPFIGFFSLFELGGDGTIDNMTYHPTSESTNKWRIDSANFPYGIQLGYDQSPLRNPQCLFYNTNYATNNNASFAGSEGVFNPVCYMGAVNPSIDFNGELSRFEIKGLNTPMTIGNGLPTSNQPALDPTGDPEQQCFNVNSNGQIAPTASTAFNLAVKQSSTKFVDSYGGLAIMGMNLLNKDGKVVKLQKGGDYGGDYATIHNTTTPVKYSADVLDNTLFGKMGFKIGQLLPEYGSPFSDYKDPVVFFTNVQQSNFLTFEDILRTTQSPMSTGAVINAPEYQPSSTNASDMPLYDLGTNMGLQARPAVVQKGLTAQDLPTKLDYPYLLIYSSIISGGTDTQYFGGADGKSKLPCVGYITRNYNNGDFFYSLEQSFNYTCTKPFTLTEVKTEIRLPDGSRPRLQPHNSVIYKITKPMALPEVIEPPPPPPQKSATRKKKEGDGDMP